METDKYGVFELLYFLKRNHVEKYVYEDDRFRLSFSEMRYCSYNRTIVLLDKNGNYIRTPIVRKIIIDDGVLHTKINIKTAEDEYVIYVYKQT